jgi:hypothetical protein
MWLGRKSARASARRDPGLAGVEQLAEIPDPALLLSVRELFRHQVVVHRLVLRHSKPTAISPLPTKRQ